MEIIVTAEGIGSEIANGSMIGNLAGGEKIISSAAICATGVEYAKLNVPGEDRLLNHGLFYGAGPSEATLCEGHVFIIGGGNSAGQAALYFADHAERVTLLVRGRSLEQSLSAYLLERIEQSPRIGVRTECVLTSLEGDRAVAGISYKCLSTGQELRAETRWVFVLESSTTPVRKQRKGLCEEEEHRKIRGEKANRKKDRRNSQDQEEPR